MTLLLREIGRFLIEASAWIVAAIVVAAGPALLVRSLAGHLGWRRLLGVAFVGAAVVAALAVRLSLPLAWAPSIGGRPLPVAWSVAGAIAGTGWAVRPKREPR